MKVINNFKGDATYGVIPYLQKVLEVLSDDNSQDAFFNGVEFIDDANLRSKHKDYKRRVLFAHWSPCEFTLRKNFFYLEAYDFFTEVYCVCPFTCKFMNKHFGYEKFKYIPYPYTNYSVISFYDYDALSCWFGSICGSDHISAIDSISKFPHKYITSQQNTWLFHPYEFNKCTHVNISTEQKLKEVSKCKSSLTFNKLYMSPASVCNYHHNDNELKHEAFEYFSSKKIMPQFKVRTHEIASCKSLILCYKDEWNLIEDFYEPNKDFIYFENFKELEEILQDIEINFEKYRPIIESAYKKVQSYSVEKIFNYIKTNDKSLITWKI